MIPRGREIMYIGYHGDVCPYGGKRGLTYKQYTVYIKIFFLKAFEYYLYSSVRMSFYVVEYLG